MLHRISNCSFTPFPGMSCCSFSMNLKWKIEKNHNQNFNSAFTIFSITSNQKNTELFYFRLLRGTAHHGTEWCCHFNGKAGQHKNIHPFYSNKMIEHILNYVMQLYINNVKQSQGCLRLNLNHQSQEDSKIASYRMFDKRGTARSQVQ